MKCRCSGQRDRTWQPEAVASLSRLRSVQQIIRGAKRDAGINCRFKNLKLAVLLSASAAPIPSPAADPTLLLSYPGASATPAQFPRLSLRLRASAKRSCGFPSRRSSLFLHHTALFAIMCIRGVSHVLQVDVANTSTCQTRMRCQCMCNGSVSE